MNTPEYEPVIQVYSVLNFSNFLYEGKIFLKKKYGKNKNWARIDQIKYLESLFLNRDSGYLYLKQRVNENDFWDYIILDGHERIKTLNNFFYNQIVLSSTIIPELINCNKQSIMNNLPELYNSFLSHKLIVYVYPHDTCNRYLKTKFREQIL